MNLRMVICALFGYLIGGALAVIIINKQEGNYYNVKEYYRGKMLLEYSEKLSIIPKDTFYTQNNNIDTVFVKYELKNE